MPFAFSSLLVVIDVINPTKIGIQYWIPMCFLFVATVQIGMLQRIDHLEEQLQAKLHHGQDRTPQSP